jgi:hypothetical protein
VARGGTTREGDPVLDGGQRADDRADARSLAEMSTPAAA